MATPKSALRIRRLTITRFRGIEKLEWFPAEGMNVIVGGGDVGKSTILDAIGMLFSPTNSTVLSNADYWHRQVDQGFMIEAVASLPDTCGVNQEGKQSWPWQWKDSEPCVPGADADAESVAEPVYRLRATGTPELDLVHEILQPDDTTTSLSAGLRRRIGLVRLSGDDRNERDLRLVQGSALDRLVSDKTLRARMGQRIDGSADMGEELLEDAKTNLTVVEAAFLKASLPSGLGIGLTGGPGISLNALLGLTALKNEIRLPVASWGAGTRRRAALEIASVHQGDQPITIIDEAERGLEPYRQRSLVTKLCATSSQVFLTTHSPAIISAATEATSWHLSANQTIGKIPSNNRRHLVRDPEAYLCRLPIVAEGQTEVGFVKAIIERTVTSDWLEAGIWVSDGGGNEECLEILRGLSTARFRFGGFVDNEGTNSGRWQKAKETLGALLFQWSTGCLEENVIAAIPEERLEALVDDPSDILTGERCRTLARRVGIQSKALPDIRAAVPDLRALIIQAACGHVPEDEQDKHTRAEFKAHGAKWFKTETGGRELALKIAEFGLLPHFDKELLPFVNAVRATLVLPDLDSLAT